MNVTIKEQDGNMVAFLAGSLDTAAAAEAEKAMSPLNDVKGKDIIIDCTDLEYISSAGLRVLLMAVKKLGNGSVTVINASEPVKEIFETTGFDQMIAVE